MAAQLSTEESILACAAELLERDGPDGVTTRAVCGAAKITAPTLYHHFGDMDGLLNELVSRGIREFTESKLAIRESSDALLDMKMCWNRFLEFALRRPWLFKLMVEQVNSKPELANEVYSVTSSRLTRLHGDGRLATDVDFAARTLHAASNGVLALLAQGVKRTEIEKTGAFLFDAIMAQLLARPKEKVRKTSRYPKKARRQSQDQTRMAT